MAAWLITAGLACCLVGTALFGIKAMHIFASRNGLFDIFGRAIEKKRMPSGRALQTITTNGRFPMLDRQLYATTVFLLTFVENLEQPATNLWGFHFLGAWAPIWTLIVLESLRRCNTGHLASYIAVPGVLIFNHSHAIATPAYLAFHLLLAPSAKALQHQQMFVSQSDLKAILFSFAMGYIVPVIMMVLPTPKLVSTKFKHTICGWYQQWNLYISILHRLFLYLHLKQETSTENVAFDSLRSVYIMAFVMAALPYWTMALVSFSAWLYPDLYSKKTATSLLPRNLLVPKSPFRNHRINDLSQGFRWLIQWDYLLGTVASAVWAFGLWINVWLAHGQGDKFYWVAGRFMAYLVVSGPVSLAVGMLWEREELIFNIK